MSGTLRIIFFCVIITLLNVISPRDENGVRTMAIETENKDGLEKLDRFWQDFLQKTNRNPALRYQGSFFFELSEFWANELLRLVLIGQKKATCSSLYAFELEHERIPQKEDFSIVTDFAGNPRCIIETVSVTILPFSAMTFEICKREGEDDNLASWKRGHERFFREEARLLGYTFSEEMPVVFEDFEVVYSD
jgi:uncharacterized protein YhfF